MGFRPKNIPQRLKPFRFSRHVSARLKPRPFKTASIGDSKSKCVYPAGNPYTLANERHYQVSRLIDRLPLEPAFWPHVPE
jgi:hypothetical protein